MEKQQLTTSVLTKGICLNLVKAGIDTEPQIKEYFRQFTQLGLTYPIIENAFLKLKKERLVNSVGELEKRQFRLVGKFPTWAADLVELESGLLNLLLERRNEREMEQLREKETTLQGGSKGPGGDGEEQHTEDHKEDTPSEQPIDEPKIDKRTREYKQMIASRKTSETSPVPPEAESKHIEKHNQNGGIPKERFTRIKISTNSGDSAFNTIEIETSSSIEVRENGEEITIKVGGKVCIE